MKVEKLQVFMVVLLALVAGDGASKAMGAPAARYGYLRGPYNIAFFYRHNPGVPWLFSVLFNCPLFLSAR